MGKFLYFSNVGDSCGIWAIWDPANATNITIHRFLFQTKPHLPNDPGDGARIEASRGEVRIPDNEDDDNNVDSQARLVLNVSDSGDAIITLAMSRALGPIELR